MDNSDPLLSELCSICHINAPKYRCPRCSTRTCSLPCTRRHKLWSQCSGIRDPAAYLKRSELATESAFDRDFNFITGIERSMERAERDVENRGIELPRGHLAEIKDAESPLESGVGRKRKLPGQGLVKGEAGFLRGAETGRVRVVRAPRGMSRNKENNSRWNPKHKCLSWTVEWISAAGERALRNCLETCSIADAYDQVFPRPKDDKVTEGSSTKEAKEERLEPASTNSEQAIDTTADATTSAAINSMKEYTAQPSDSEVEDFSGGLSKGQKQETPESHRDLYFYLHRPRTTTKKPVLAPLSPSSTLSAALRGRTVLEFPTIYSLREAPEALLAEGESSSYILEMEYLRTAAPEVFANGSAESGSEGIGNEHETNLPGPVNLDSVDENKVLEVLKQDLFEPVPESEQ